MAIALPRGVANVIVIYKKYHAQGFDIIGISLDSRIRQGILPSLQMWTGRQYFDGLEAESKTGKKICVDSIPMILACLMEAGFSAKTYRGAGPGGCCVQGSGRQQQNRSGSACVQERVRREMGLIRFGDPLNLCLSPCAAAPSPKPIGSGSPPCRFGGRNCMRRIPPWPVITGGEQRPWPFGRQWMGSARWTRPTHQANSSGITLPVHGVHIIPIYGADGWELENINYLHRTADGDDKSWSARSARLSVSMGCIRAPVRAAPGGPNVDNQRRQRHGKNVRRGGWRETCRDI